MEKNEAAIPLYHRNTHTRITSAWKHQKKTKSSSEPPDYLKIYLELPPIPSVPRYTS